jgi:hypothetical protein
MKGLIKLAGFLGLAPDPVFAKERFVAFALSVRPPPTTA